ncbi:MAG: NADPH-dependent reductase [Ilumatobacteraceae bacterium]|nr:NADPH-dependent reductase [Ilumatobacteraceae bacterium]
MCGSLQASSGNLTLLRAVAELVPAGVEYEIYDGMRTLPHFDLDIEATGPTPPEVTVLRATIGAADALLIASPEYGHSLPGSLKNAIDWMIGSGELERKIVGVTASVVHPARGRRGLDALMRTLAAVSAQVVGGEPIAKGAGDTEALRTLVSAVVEAVHAAEGSTVGP